MDKYLEIKEIFESREDKENAIAMSVKVYEKYV